MQAKQILATRHSTLCGNKVWLTITCLCICNCVASARAQQETPPQPEPKKQETSQEERPPSPADLKPTEKKSDSGADKTEKAEPKTEEKPPTKRSPGKPASPGTSKEQAPKEQGEPVTPAEKTAKPTKDSPESVDKRLSLIEERLAKVLQGLESLQPNSAKPPNTTASPDDDKSKSAKKVELPGKIPDEFLKALEWRSIGPANMGGRIVDLAVNPQDPSNWWAATATGGLIMTRNNGVTLEHQFDKEEVVSVGAVAVSASNPQIVWVGTGENNPRNSVSYGNGVYKSLDGGKTWTHAGLKKTFQIGKVVIHPKDPNVVYVGALGRLYGTNEDRGVFKTTDAGATWEKVLYIDDRTGIVDMQMHPTNPDTLIVAAWERLRDGFDSWPGEVPMPDGYDGYDPIRKWGPGSGLYKTVDGGKAWKKLTKGLPTNQLGRIGFDYFQADPNIVYAIVDCEKIGKGPDPLPVLWGAVVTDRDGGSFVEQVYEKSPAEASGVKIGDKLSSLNGKEITSFSQVLDVLREKKVNEIFRISVTRNGEVMELECTLASRRTGASTVWMGIIGEDDPKGIKLTTITADGPAEKSGLLANDIIVEVEGKAEINYDALLELVRSKRPGDKLPLKVLRANDKVELSLALEERPGSQRPPAQQSNVYLGIQGRDAKNGGAELTEITKDGPAAKAGLLAGDRITKVDGSVIDDYRAFVGKLQTAKVGDKLALSVVRATETKQFDVQLEKRPSPTRPYTAQLGGQAENVQDMQGGDGFEYGGVYKSVDGGESWQRVNSLHSRPMYFSVIRVDPKDASFVYLLGVSQYKSENGGLTFDSRFGSAVHADGHAIWIDPRDGRHIIVGVDGGVYVTYDRGKNWDHLNTLALGQFYHVAIGPTYPYYLYGGLQDNGTWGGPAQTLSSTGPINEDWISIGGGDGFRCAVDPKDPNLVYYESQNGAIGRRNLKTGERASIRPPRVEGEPAYRFNWNTPFQLSNFNSNIFYAAGNYVFRSFDRGSDLKVISPEITLTERGSATAFVESPRSAEVLYAGTDDGALWVTKDGGKNWKEIGTNLDLPAPRWVASVEASRFADGRVYVCLDGHRSDDDEPYLFVSEDYGDTWKSLRNNIPWGSTRVLREDPKNENLLFVGTEFKVYASTNRGQDWNCLNTNLPTVPVLDFAFHPENGEIVAATHGRSLWIADITPLRQLNAQALADSPLLMQPTVAVKWRREPTRGGASRRFVGQNPAAGASIYYTLPQKAKEVMVRIADVKGEVVRELPGSNRAGIQQVRWDLIIAPPPPPAPPGLTAGRGPGLAGRRSGSGEGRPSGRGPGSPSAPGNATAQPETAAESEGESESAAPTAPPTAAAAATQARPQQRGRGEAARRIAPSGSYRVTLVVDGKEFVQELRIVNDPMLPQANPLGEETQSFWGLDENEEQEEEEATTAVEIRD